MTNCVPGNTCEKVTRSCGEIEGKLNRLQEAVWSMSGKVASIENKVFMPRPCENEKVSDKPQAPTVSGRLLDSIEMLESIYQRLSEIDDALDGQLGEDMKLV